MDSPFQHTRNLLLGALFLFHLLKLNSSLDTITSSNIIKDGDLLVSSGRIFALGFFSKGNPSHRYIGIWYYEKPEQTIVWVANRERPLSNNSGALSMDSCGNLLLYQGIGSFPVWSTNVSSKISNDSAAAQLLDSGNLVLIHGLSRSVVWQSFDHPTDTYLPGMKLGLDQTTGLDWFLTSWKSDDDPAPGSFSYRINLTGYPQLIMYKDKVPYWRAGSWTGTRWSGIPTMVSGSILNATFVNSATEVSISYGLIKESILIRLVVNETGFLKLTWIDKDKRWNEFWSSPEAPCDYYRKCGPNGICDPYNVYQFECKCLPGLIPKSPSDWSLREGSGGCIRTQGASTCRSGEGFVKLTDVKVPDTSTAEVDMRLNLKECEQKCLRNCSCTAYSSANERRVSYGCLTWHGDLVDTRTFLNIGQDLYVRVDAVELAKFRTKKRAIAKKEMLVITLVSAMALLVLGGFLTYQLRLKREREGCTTLNLPRGVATSPPYFNVAQGMKDMDGESRSDSDLPFFDFSTIAAATEHFSLENKLGQGGFGSVYKGVMDDGKEIAVKRLSKNSGQGINEFKNEVRVIAKLQHRNLVKLLGCCTQEEEKLLIYEYLQNKSLDSFLFDETKRILLDWKRRFEIAYGIARGLLYLHHDSRLRIIHRDLKASNVLLDDALNPKISDFGMARICGEDQTEGTTKRVVGTFGYMAPEYMIEGLFSLKSDVYSFGVLLLEIIAGKRISGYHHVNPSPNLICHTWELWNEGKCMEILDKLMGGSYSDEMVLRCIQIALLCVQEFAEDRPTMSTVVFMLGNIDMTLPSPRPPPAFICKRNCCAVDPLSSNGTTSSVNHVTVTMPDAR